MPRIRTIKPEFFSDPKVAQLPFRARLLFIALWTFADDEGRNRAITKELAGYAFPLDDSVTNSNVETDLQLLQSLGMITLYEANSLRLYQVNHWEHQSINRPTPSKFQPCCESSRSTHGVLSESLTEDSLRARKEMEVEMELGNGKGGASARRPPDPAMRIPPDRKDVAAYFKEKGSSGTEARKFWDHYEANGWKVGRNPMKKWHAAASGWITRQPEYSNGHVKAEPETPPRYREVVPPRPDPEVSPEERARVRQALRDAEMRAGEAS